MLHPQRPVPRLMALPAFLLFYLFALLCGPLRAADTPATAALTSSQKPTAASCLECHAEADFTMRKGGKTISLTVPPKAFEGTAHAALSCVDCHAGYDPEQQPHIETRTPVSCTACHDSIGKSHAFHPALAKPQKGKPTPDTDCKACHGTHAITDRKHKDFPFAKARATDSCGNCHAEAKAAFLLSPHATKGGSAFSPTPSCVSCHSKPIVTPPGKPSSAAHKLAQVQLCESCHVKSKEVASKTALGASFVTSFDRSVHGAALLRGNAAAPACSNCHGSHDTRQAIEQGSSVNIRKVAETCARCHRTQANEYAGSIHAVALAKGVVDAPSCTRCHGEHEILSHNDPASATNAKNLSQQVCASCHGSVRLAKKYNLQADRFATFSDSYHGLAVRGGAVEVVNCASCHGEHGVRSQNDPASSTHKDRLAQTCGNCHPGASEGFTIGNVHASESSPDRSPVLYWVSTVYVLMIFVIVGGMALHNLLDFIKKARRKLLVQKGIIVEHVVEHRLYLRMTVHERLQHAALVLCFTLLVLTGFMLRYPEAWWVVAIHNVSASAFEWRGIIHRIAGVAMLAAGFWHGGYLAFSPQGRRLFIELLPRWNDVTDPFKVLRYNLGLARTKPEFGRFCYIEKAEYWALVWGTLLMGATGAILWFDNTSIGLLTKLGFDVARTIHFYEAVLATLAIIVWHFYFVIFNPDVYPMNLSWLTGRMSEEEMREEHPAELRRLKEEASQALSAPPLQTAQAPEGEPPPGEPPVTPPPAQQEPPAPPSTPESK